MEDKQKITIEVPKKKYFVDDIAKQILVDGEIIYKYKNNYLRVNILNKPRFLKHLELMIKLDRKDFNKIDA